jgi:serine/threonine protein kinase
MTAISAGDTLDDYRIDHLVASGGMASVFRATELRTGVTVAIKVPHPEAECDVVFYDRFQREEQIGRMMDYPGVIKEISSGQKSRTYLVLEWVDGQLLREVLSREGRLSVDRAVRIAVNICKALEHVHSQGVVHRDLKPENVFVDGRDGIKLFDFGIASMRGARRLTFGKFSRLTGTADYIAPEQVRGKRGDASTDIYALGVMLYEMLTGTLPFEGDNVLAVMNHRLHEDATPPREINPEIPARLQETVLRAMARERRDRYWSAAELAWDLEHQDDCGVAEQARPGGLKRRHARAYSPGLDSLQRRILVYVALAMIPIFLFGLMLVVSRRA